jgi:hypothetical protein
MINISSMSRKRRRFLLLFMKMAVKSAKTVT